MIKPSALKKAYLFAYTDNAEYIQQLEKLESHFPLVDEVMSGSKLYSKVISTTHTNTEGSKNYYYSGTINNHNDYDLNRIEFEKYPVLDNSFDTLLSYAFYEKGYFMVGTDYLAIFNHFYFYDRNTFICSNNLFLIAKLVEATLSIEAIYETLFFRFPKGENTFFSGIKCLKPFQQLQFSEQGVLKLSNSVSYNDIVFSENANVFDNIKQYFNTIKPKLNHNTFLSFSGGSDSMCVLAMLRNQDINFKLASFQGHNDWDTARIKKIAKEYKIPFQFIDKQQLETKQVTEEYIFTSNGTSPAARFLVFYKSLPSGSNIFDGYHSILGDYSDAFLYPPHIDSLKGMDLTETLKKHFSSLNDKFIDGFKAHIESKYANTFQSCNTEEGLSYIQKYSAEFIPSRVFSGVFSAAEQSNVNVLSFFLSRKFFSYVHYNSFGLRKTFSARNDYKNVIIKDPLARLVKELDRKTYLRKMDRGYSFQDMHEFPNLIPFKKKTRALRFKFFEFLKSSKGAFVKSEIQEEKINSYLNSFVKNHELMDRYNKQSFKVISDVLSVMEKIKF